MMKRTLFFLMIGLFGLSKLHAQATFAELENNKIMYPSPTAASLGKYGEYPVSLYNGLVNIGQDIVTVNSGKLSLNVSLSYHASGNKPSDIPGWVGLGFSLNAGGVITRIVKDLPDDSENGFYNATSTVQYLWNNFPDSEFIERYLNGTLDPRSDIYQFNFCGRTGEFVFDWSGNIHFKQQVPFKVEALAGGIFGGFRITTDDGTIYTFDQAEHSNLSTMTINPPASSWYLTKIKNLSGDSIVLKYTEPTGHYRYKQYGITRKEATGSLGFFSDETQSYSYLDVETGPIVNQPSSMDEVIYLDEIDFNNGKLFFGKSTRTDPYYVPSGINPAYAEEKKLDLITLKDNSDRIVKNWKFEYYENSTERLKLKNLIIRGSDQVDVQKYTFSYNAQRLPLAQLGPNASNPYISNDVDYWGYYNGFSNGDNRIPKMYISEFNQFVGSADRTITPALVKSEILEKITYPTGGYTSFEYESNDYSDQGPSYAAGQNPMTYSSTAPESYEFTYNKDGGFETDPATVSFTLTETTHVNVKYSCGAEGTAHEWANPGSYDYDYQLAAGTYTLASLLNTGLLTSPTSADIIKVHGWVTVYKMGTMVPYTAKTGPGVRIKSITTNDGSTSTTRSFEYTLQNSVVSSGYLSMFPAFYVLFSDIAFNGYGYYITTDPINDIGDDAPVGYSRVVERFPDNSSIVHNYSDYNLYPDDIMAFTNEYSNSSLAHMSSNADQRGLETNTIYYNADGTKQKEILNSYEILSASITNIPYIEVKPTVGLLGAVSGYEVNNVNASLTSLYYVHSRFIYNGSQSEVTYDKNGQHPITALVNKYYDNVNHLQPTRTSTLTSDGSSIGTITTYPDDYAPGEPFIDHMQANHLTSFPIEQVTYKQKDTVVTIIDGNMVTYKAQGAALPNQLLKLETSSPILQANFKFSNRSMGILPPSGLPSLFSADAHYQPELNYTQYDTKGNLLESARPDGVKTSYLWGYHQELPIAKIIGTDYSTALSKINNPSLLNSPSSDQVLRTELDNLRTIPGSFATTYTFAPLTGVTSQTEPNGRTTYYEYDLFNRLSIVRDHDQNILKKLCYNYAGQLGQCNVYRSAAIDADYYSQNCASGQSPIAYHVSVPQGNFASSIDQATADQFAQDYAQNQANEHGSCIVLDVSVYGENDHGVSITILMHNVASGQDYSFTSLPHSGETLGDVPPGNYDITLTPQSSGGYYSFSVGCGYYNDGFGALTFYGVDISASCNTISINN